jgi:N-acetylneuraminic acid mutarotase
MSDLWSFSPASAQWTWVAGPSTANGSGVYGSVGVPSTTSHPGGRSSGTTWIDANKNLWVFGGSGYDSTGTNGALNDLWEFNTATNQWTWVTGSNVANATGNYGVLGVAAPTNAPGAREASVGWTDSAGNFWLFGGVGYDSAGFNGNLNDLWEFSPSTGQWTWVSGSAVANSSGVYGTLGTESASNSPGGRFAPVAWTDASGNFWLFGGFGYDSAGTNSELNDLWEYSTSTHEWTWISGSALANSIGSYGTEGTVAATNVPGARDSATAWIDSSGNLWLFGGAGIDATGTSGYLSDLWEFNVSSKQWTWVNGAAAANTIGSYGTIGSSSTSNLPGGRFGAAGWADSSNNLWLFGGQGVDSAGTVNVLNDLWKFVP